MARPKGSKNKATEVQEYLTRAFNRCIREADWDTLIGSAMGQANEGKPALFSALLPYIARKMPEAIELDAKVQGGNQIVLVVPADAKLDAPDAAAPEAQA